MVDLSPTVLIVVLNVNSLIFFKKKQIFKPDLKILKAQNNYKPFTKGVLNIKIYIG